MPEDLRKENIAKCLPPEERPSGPAGWTEEEAQEACETRSEKELQRQISQYLGQRDIFYFCARTDKRTTNRVGQPDFIFAVKMKGHAIPVAVECKSATGTCSDEQVKVMAKLFNNGWVVAEIRQLSELKQLIEHLEAQ